MAQKSTACLDIKKYQFLVSDEVHGPPLEIRKSTESHLEKSVDFVKGRII